MHRNPVEIRKTGAELPTVAVNANVSAADMETACPAFVSLHEAVPLVTVVRLQLRLVLTPFLTRVTAREVDTPLWGISVTNSESIVQDTGIVPAD